MSEFKFASWVIHMSILIFFSFIVGIVMKEWKEVSKPTYLTLIIGLIIGLIILLASFVVMTIGSLQGNGL